MGFGGRLGGAARGGGGGSSRCVFYAGGGIFARDREDPAPTVGADAAILAGRVGVCSGVACRAAIGGVLRDSKKNVRRGGG